LPCANEKQGEQRCLFVLQVLLLNVTSLMIIVCTQGMPCVYANRIGDPVKPLEAPRVTLIWGLVGMLLFLTLGILDVLSGAPVWRITAYAFLAISAAYLFIRALWTLLSKTRPGS
jgi:hypothetical protein